MLNNCLSCALQADKCSNLYRIVETKHFYIEQDYQIIKKGYLVVVSKRHVYSIDDFTNEERFELIEIIHNIRKGLRVEFKIMSMLLLQREKTKSHFHFCIFPNSRFNFIATSIVGKFYFELLKRININTLEKIKKENEKLMFHLVQ